MAEPINKYLPPTPGLFSRMTGKAWDNKLDPSFMDIELWTRIGGLSGSPLFRYYVQNGTLDVVNLSRMLEHRFGENWKRIWDALHLLYTIDETKSSTQIREITHTLKGLETRDLATVEKQIRDLAKAAQDTSARTGSVARSETDSRKISLTDAETRNLTGSSADTGTEKLTDTFNDTQIGSDVLTKAGVDKHISNDREDRHLTTKDTGTQANSGSEAKTGSGSGNVATKVHGVGSSALIGQTETSNSDSPNYNTSMSNTRTDNLTHSDDGYIIRAISAEDSYVERSDSRALSDKHTGTIDHATQFGKSTSTTDKGTVSTTHSGTDENTVTGTETYNNLTETRSGSESDTGTVDNTGSEKGTIGQDVTETTKDEYSERGSSALGSFQDAINQELEGRTGHGWNFINLVIEDVQSMIAGKVWVRNGWTL